MVNEIKIKYNTDIIKWLLTVFLLLGNLLLLVADRGELTFMIIWEISINSLAVFSFIMLSIFPRLYYVFDEKGCSFQNRYGKKYTNIAWEDVISISYGYFGIIPDGLVIKWKEHCIKKEISFTISPKQARMLYEKCPQIKALVDNLDGENIEFSN